MTHTKGEWTAVSDDSMYGTYTICEVAEQHSKILIGEDEAEHKQVTAEDNANARLISSAPEMYDILKKIVENNKLGHDKYDYGQLIVDAEQAIAKAEDK